jgi:hypothetical protein
MASARVARALFRSIQKEIRSLTLSNSRIFLLEAPDHRKWGHGQYVEKQSQVDVLLGMLPARASTAAVDWAMTKSNIGESL